MGVGCHGLGYNLEQTETSDDGGEKREEGRGKWNLRTVANKKEVREDLPIVIHPILVAQHEAGGPQLSLP